MENFVNDWLKAAKAETYDKGVLNALEECVRSGSLDEGQLLARLVALSKSALLKAKNANS